MAKSKFEHTIGSFSELGNFKEKFKAAEATHKKSEEPEIEKVGNREDEGEKEREEKKERPPRKTKKRAQKKPNSERSSASFSAHVRKEINRLGEELVKNRKKAEFYEKQGDKKRAAEYRKKTDYFRRQLEDAKAARDRIKKKEKPPAKNEEKGPKIKSEKTERNIESDPGSENEKKENGKEIKLSKLEELERQLDAAKRAGDEELVEEIAKEVEDFKKSADELLEEAQKLEASEKFRVAREKKEKRKAQIKELWEKYAMDEEKKEKRLEKKVADSRRALAREYSELKEKKWGIFGSEKIEDEEKAKRVAVIEKEYRDALNAYRRYLWNKNIEEMKSADLNGAREEELRKKGEEILAKTVVDEAIKLNDLKTEMSLQFNGKNRAEKILRASKRAIDRYRKIPAKYKYMLSAALFTGGLGAGYIGGVVGWSLAGGVFAGKWFQRIFGAPAAAVALEAKIKSSQEKKEEKKIFKKFRSFFPSLGLESSSAMNKSNEKWNKELFKFEREKKRKKIGRFTLSGGVGAIIFSGAIGHALSNAWDWLHGTSANIEIQGMKPSEPSSEPSSDAGIDPEKINPPDETQAPPTKGAEGSANSHPVEASQTNTQEMDENVSQTPESTPIDISDKLVSQNVEKYFNVPSWTYPEFSDMKLSDFMNLKDEGFYDVSEPWVTPWVDYDYDEFSELQKKIIELYKNLPAPLKESATEQPVKEFIKENFNKLFNVSK